MALEGLPRGAGGREEGVLVSSLGRPVWHLALASVFSAGIQTWLCLFDKKEPDSLTLTKPTEGR